MFSAESSKSGDERCWQVPDGRRVYAIGDVHGRLDLLRELADAIETHDSNCASANSSVILLGDLVDRGPDSKGVINFVRDWQSRRDVRVLMGNHEEMMLASLDDSEVLRYFLRFGGRETILSYGYDAGALATSGIEEIFAWLQDHFPADHREWMHNLHRSIVEGDYLFVHAGIMPGIPIDQQDERDLRWIREPFLSHADLHPYMVVHGHTIEQEAVERPNRIGIDTGAYWQGRLTALVLEGNQRRFFQAHGEPNRT
ncbi:MAG: serine/threonine protein phosphatase [Novosphingobium sp.]|nr:serine/threonine protein phosphatase [Novosphingobium sp.]